MKKSFFSLVFQQRYVSPQHTFPLPVLSPFPFARSLPAAFPFARRKLEQKGDSSRRRVRAAVFLAVGDSLFFFDFSFLLLHPHPLRLFHDRFFDSVTDKLFHLRYRQLVQLDVFSETSRPAFSPSLPWFSSMGLPLLPGEEPPRPNARPLFRA